jgi:hypothetical protein
MEGEAFGERQRTRRRQHFFTDGGTTPEHISWVRREAAQEGPLAMNIGRKSF